MLFHRETGGCSGRGFANASVNGFLAKFKTWVQTAYPSGPSWSIIDDQSMDPGQGKWAKIVSYQNGVGTSFDTLAEIAAITNGSFRITIGTTTVNVTGITFSGIATWDDVAARIQTAIRAASATPEFTGATCYHCMSRLMIGSANSELRHKFVIIAGIRGVDISYLSTSTVSVGTDLSGGGHLYMQSGAGVISSGTNYPYIVVCSKSSPNWNDTPANKYIQIGHDSGAGYIFIKTFLHWDPTLHMGFNLWSSTNLTTVDAGPFAYDFRGGSEMMNIQSFISGVWYSYVTDEWVGDNTFVEPLTTKGVTTGAVTTAMNSVTLGSGQGAAFNPDMSYFLIDLDRSESIQYLKIAPGGVSGDTITFTTNFNMEAKAGAILSPYYHRFYNATTGYQGYYKSRIPYISFFRAESYLVNHWSSDVSACNITTLSEYIMKMNPNDTGNYACMRPGITEMGNATGVTWNRSYGACKNLYVVYKGTMNAGTDGKIINGKNYLFFKTADIFEGGSSNMATLIPDFDENI